MQDAAFAARLAVMALAGVIAVIAVFTAPQERSVKTITPLQAERMAQCIAEFDYTHPQHTLFDNLEVALMKECR